MKTRSQSSMVLYASSMKRGDALRILGKHSRGTVRLNNINKMEAEGPFNPKRICSQSSNTYCPYNIWNNFLLQTQNINNIYHQPLQLWLQLKLSQLLEEWNWSGELEKLKNHHHISKLKQKFLWLKKKINILFMHFVNHSYLLGLEMVLIFHTSKK